jgi:hypothetical protein
MMNEDGLSMLMRLLKRRLSIDVVLCNFGTLLGVWVLELEDLGYIRFGLLCTELMILFNQWIFLLEIFDDPVQMKSRNDKGH